MSLSSPTRKENQPCDNDSNAAEARTQSLRNALFACALPLWLTALISVPYLFNFRTYATLPHSPLPLLIALGMIVAAVSLPSIAKRTTPSTLILIRKACLIGGMASLALASLILARVPSQLYLSPYTMQFGLFDLFFMVEKVLNVASKPLWLCGGFCMAIALIIPCNLKSEADARRAHPSNAPATLWLTLPLLCLMGFLFERTWGTLSFPVYDDPFAARPWWTYACPIISCVALAGALTASAREHSLQKAESFTARNVVIAFAAGIICWNLWTRGVPYPDGNELAISLGACACTILLSVLAILICRLSHRPKTQEKQSGLLQRETTSQAIHEALERLDLAPREYEVARMLLQGKSSSQTAELLGLKPPTVRTYLRRSYAKAGVANASEFIDKLMPQAAVDDEGDREAAPSPHEPDRSTSVIAHAVECLEPYSPELARCTSAGLLILTLAPIFEEQTAWGLGQPLIYLASIGLVVASLAAMSAASYAREHLSVQGQTLPQAPQSPRAMVANTALAIALALGMFSLALYRLQYLLLNMDSWPLLAVAGGFSAGLSLIIGYGTPSPSTSPVTNKDAKNHAVLDIGLKLMTPMLVLIGITHPVALAATAFFLALVGGSATTICLAMRDRTKPEAALEKELPASRKANATGASQVPDPFDILLLAACFALGSTIEETWRVLTDFSIWGASLPFIIVALGCSLLVTIKANGRKAILPVSAIALASAASCMLHSGHVAALIALCLTLVLTAESMASKTVPQHISTCRQILAFACGLAITCWLVNRYSDITGWNSVALSGIGGVERVHQFALYLAGTFFCAVDVCCALLTKHAIDNMAASELSQTASNVDADSIDRRIINFLFAKGMNETQAAVLLEIVHGKTTSAISEYLNYSRGTVNSARLAGYRMLDVHSTSQLISVIRAGIGL